MPVIPERPGRIRVTGQDDTVIFEGEGQIIFNDDPEMDHLPGQAVLRIREGNYHAQVDLSGLRALEQFEMAVDFEIPPLRFEPDPDPLVVPEAPRPVLTRLDLGIPPGMALAMREEIYRGHPDHQPRRSFYEEVMGRRDRADLGDLTMEETDRIISAGEDWRREWERALMSRTPSARQQVIERVMERSMPHPYDVAEAYEQGVLPLDRARQAMGYGETYEARERLMAETRAEFPHDPYGYGRRCPEGPMRWTPPDDGEEVRPCP